MMEREARDLVTNSFDCHKLTCLVIDEACLPSFPFTLTFQASVARSACSGVTLAFVSSFCGILSSGGEVAPSVLALSKCNNHLTNI